ncbi:MAG: hypothetical protein KDE31_38125, partial [Caldilineaceae bacterium]|nr:hypothetical protein [Caldilineaceae bacterium]
MTEHQVAYLWTFDDYQQRLQHENYFVRHWAYDQIAKQYPDQQTQAAALLIGDSNRQLNSEAIKALGKLGGADHEQTLLAMRPNAAPNQHAWITLALAEMHSAIFLPQLLAEVQALDLTTNTRSHFTTYAAVESLGFYNDPAAIALLWQLLETYPSDDTFTGHVVAALLKHPAATTLPQILQRWSVLQRAAQRQPQVGNALATVIEQRQLFEGLPYETNLRAQWTMIEEWFEQPLARPAAVEAAIAADTMPEPSALLAAYWQAMQTTAAARGDHPAAWIAAWSVGDPPIGYQARTIYCWQALETLATLPVTAIHGAHQTEFVTLGTVLLAHYLVDENDEQRLAELQGDDARSAARLAILASPRKVVLTTVEDQVAALGPAVIPNLVDLLQDDRLWPTVRALRVITKIA